MLSLPVNRLNVYFFNISFNKSFINESLKAFALNAKSNNKIYQTQGDERKVSNDPNVKQVMQTRH